MPGSKRRFLSDLWTLTKPYWKSEERFKSGLLLAVIVGMSLGIVYLNVLFNEWNNLFYNSLQNKDVDAFFRLLGRFSILAALFIIVGLPAQIGMLCCILRQPLFERGIVRLDFNGFAGFIKIDAGRFLPLGQSGFHIASISA